MKKIILLLLLMVLTSASTMPAEVSDKPVFGPKQYDVIKRDGELNSYQETFSVAEGAYLIKIQNGDSSPSMSEYIDFMINGQSLLNYEKYGYSIVACVEKLQKNNSFDLVLYDAAPLGAKKKDPPPRFVILSIMPLSVNLPKGAYGVLSLKQLDYLAGLLQKIKKPDTFSLAATVINLKNTISMRTEAVRKLSDSKSSDAQDLLVYLFNDALLNPDVRSEVALALGSFGDKRYIPFLVNGVTDPEPKIRIGAARALSMYREVDTRDSATKLIQETNYMQRAALLQTISDSGWKPIGVFMALAESTDPYTANLAIALLGVAKDPKATDMLLRLFENPDPEHLNVIITALGESKDSRAIQPLSRIAGDATARAGVEIELANALATIGDKTTAPLIEAIIKETTPGSTRRQLRAAYKKLTGTAYTEKK